MPDASYLALLAPQFLLRHPYGKKSDPITSFAFEEFNRTAGLRGMLWGHPSLLALCVLGVRGGQLTIGDLPFHHYVDADGDSVALPCTKRLINTQASAMLRDYGINAVMAHKGEALVRLAGLEAVNGDGLAAAGGAAPRKSPSDSRGAIGSKVEGQARVDWAPAQRSAGTVAVSAIAPLAAEEATDDAPPADGPAAEENTVAAADAPASAGDSELNALLASLDDAPAPAPADAPPAEEPEMDPDLAALLASLN